MKTSAETLREHIDLVRAVDEGLLGTAAKVAGGALAGFGGGSLANWFNKKDTTPDKPKPTSPSSSPAAPNKASSSPAANKDSSSSDLDDIDVGKYNSNGADPNQRPEKDGFMGYRTSDQPVDHLGYAWDDYVPQDVIPMSARANLPEGGSRYERVLKAITNQRGTFGQKDDSNSQHVFLNSWNCQGACIQLAASLNRVNAALQKSKSSGGYSLAESQMDPAFRPFGLEELGNSRFSLRDNAVGELLYPVEVYTLVSSRNTRKLLTYACVNEIIPFRSAKGPGIRDMWLSYFGPKDIWDTVGIKHYQAIYESFNWANGAGPLAPKDD